MNMIELTESEYNAIMESRIMPYSQQELYCDAIQEGVCVVTEAKFSFFPKFHESDELRKFDKTAKEADDLLNSHGTPSKTGVQTCLRIIMKIIRIYESLCNIITLPLCLTIVGIIPHVMSRMIVLAADCGEEALAKSQGKEIISKLSEAIEKTEDEDKKEKLIAMRDKLSKSVNNIDGKAKKNSDDDED